MLDPSGQSEHAGPGQSSTVPTILGRFPVLFGLEARLRGSGSGDLPGAPAAQVLPQVAYPRRTAEAAAGCGVRAAGWSWVACDGVAGVTGRGGVAGQLPAQLVVCARRLICHVDRRSGATALGGKYTPRTHPGYVDGAP